MKIKVLRETGEEILIDTTRDAVAILLSPTEREKLSDVAKVQNTMLQIIQIYGGSILAARKGRGNRENTKVADALETMPQKRPSGVHVLLSRARKTETMAANPSSATAISAMDGRMLAGSIGSTPQ